MADNLQDDLDGINLDLDFPLEFFENPNDVFDIDVDTDFASNGQSESVLPDSHLTEAGYLSTTQFELPVVGGLPQPPIIPHQAGPQEVEITGQVAKRKQQNRTAAKKYRNKKKQSEQSLKDSVAELQRQKEHLEKEKSDLTAEVNCLWCLLSCHSDCITQTGANAIRDLLATYSPYVSVQKAPANS